MANKFVGLDNSQRSGDAFSEIKMQRILKPPTSSRVIAMGAGAEEDAPCAEDCGVLDDG